jgi:hypothetical protein
MFPIVPGSPAKQQEFLEPLFLFGDFGSGAGEGHARESIASYEINV